ncbi:MAG: 30S ribosomal protein S12 methylthiotransferase RimO [Peptococcaceae bacterium]|nr:30S ribosomal protein S12 methylthiotransferase RimO [Peptococcaceae bacterium]
MKGKKEVKIAAISLGCDKNTVDTEVMLGYLARAGYRVTARAEDADVVLINTCAFINDAKEESIETILSIAEEKQGRKLIVTGCLAQRYHRELLQEIPEIDGLLGTGNIQQIADTVGRVVDGETVVDVGAPGFLWQGTPPDRVRTTAPYMAYVKIAEGCNNCCTYCIIPRLRGKYRSRMPSDILSEVDALVRKNAKEIILVAQDTTRYGLDLSPPSSLSSLMRKLVTLQGLKWLRVLYCYPTGITDEFIRTIAEEPKICRYLDIPLQHASDNVLRRMGRPAGAVKNLYLIRRLRAEVPGIMLRSTFIVGFPGETEEDFQELLHFLEAAQFDHAGFFPYSCEEGTRAAAMTGQVDEETKRRRWHEATQLQERISFERNLTRIGTTMEVLVEGKESGFYVGRSEGDAPDVDGRVIFTSKRPLEAGCFASVRITGAFPNELEGIVNGEDGVV